MHCGSHATMHTIRTGELRIIPVDGSLGNVKVDESPGQSCLSISGRYACLLIRTHSSRANGCICYLINTPGLPSFLEGPGTTGRLGLVEASLKQPKVVRDGTC